MERGMMNIDEISDRLEIQDLSIRYADAIDRKDFDQLDLVFTPDAVIDYTAFGGIAGNYPKIKAWLAEVLAPLPGFQHLVANPSIRLTGNSASGRIMCLNPMVMPGTDDQLRVGFHGLWYIDDYLRTADGWRIARRSEERCFSHNFGEPG
jgi:hypothetical protein